MTIEAHIDIPATCKTQDDIEKHLAKILSVLSDSGVSFNVSIGNETS